MPRIFKEKVVAGDKVTFKLPNQAEETGKVLFAYAHVAHVLVGEGEEPRRTVHVHPADLISVEKEPTNG